LNEVEIHILKDIVGNNDYSQAQAKVSNQMDLKEQIHKIQNDSYNFIFEESKAKSEKYNSFNEFKNKFICEELVNININNTIQNNSNIEIEKFQDNFSEKNDGNQLKRMFSFDV